MSAAEPMTRPLAGRVAVVTGAARGIGRAAAVALAAAGADVAGVDVAGPVSPILDFPPATADDLAETGRLVAAAGVRWSAHVADQRDIAAVRAVAEAVRRDHGGLDVLFANAGIQAFKPLLEMADPDWHDQIDVNLTGTANVLRVFAPLLVDRGGGAKTPLGVPWVQPEDVAPLVVFLASDQARMVSGTAFAATGGSAHVTA